MTDETVLAVFGLPRTLDERRSGFDAAIEQVLLATLPGRPRAPRSALDAVLAGLPRELARLSRHDRVRFECAAIWVHLHQGSGELPRRLATADCSTGLDRLGGKLTPRTRSACYGILAEAELLDGRSVSSLELGKRALDLAEEADSDSCRTRALGLVAAGQALGGEFGEARRTVGLIARPDAGTAAAKPWPEALALINIFVRSRDVQQLDALAAALTCAGGDVIERAVARLAQAFGHVVRREWHAVVAATQPVGLGFDARNCPRLLIDEMVCLQALALLQLGEAEQALKAVSDRNSPPGHCVCFEVVRSNVHLAAGHPRKALSVTQSCVDDPRGHSLRSLGSVLVRRAAAYAALGYGAKSEAAFSEASHLAFDNGFLTPTVGLPSSVQRALITRLRSSEPDFARSVDARLTELMGEQVSSR